MALTDSTRRTRHVSYRWRLRELMAEHDMQCATALLDPLAARGVRLSAVAAWRLVTQPPTRLSVPVLAALCDIFDCTPDDLIHTYAWDVDQPSGDTLTTPSSPARLPDTFTAAAEHSPAESVRPRHGPNERSRAPDA